MNTSTPPQTFGPYSPIKQAQTLFFVSGQVGIDAATGQLPISAADQTHQALQNMQRILKEHNLQLDNVVKTIIFLTDINDFEEVNKAYGQYFSHPRPARSTVGVAALPSVSDDVATKIEIEAIAYKQPEPKEIM